MALDRQSIERKDFPIARRGYDPAAVDEHLARLAEQIEELQRQAAAAPASGGGEAVAQPRGAASLALAASEQVRTIVEAAEVSAAEIERAARDDAARIRAEAEAAARRTRDDAVERSEEHVAKVSEATSLMLQRVDAMETEIGALVESLRTGGNRLNADLSLLQGNMGDLYDAAGGSPPPAAPAPPSRRAAVPEPAAPVAAPPAAAAAPEPPAPAPARVPEPAATPVPEPTAGPTPDASEAELLAMAAGAAQPPAAPAAPAPEPEPEPAAEEPAAPAAREEGGDVEGARLIALNMALNGSPREETDAYLRDNFDLADRDALLDEVYATVGG